MKKKGDFWAPAEEIHPSSNLEISSMKASCASACSPCWNSPQLLALFYSFLLQIMAVAPFVEAAWIKEATSVAAINFWELLEASSS